MFSLVANVSVEELSIEWEKLCDASTSLPGVKERAKLAGVKLAIWSDLDFGTEIELTIPAAIAYGKLPVARRSMSSEQETR